MMPNEDHSRIASEGGGAVQLELCFSTKFHPHYEVPEGWVYRRSSLFHGYFRVDWYLVSEDPDQIGYIFDGKSTPLMQKVAKLSDRGISSDFKEEMRKAL